MGLVWRTALLALLGACSFALSGPQPNRPRGTAPRCDTGKGLVVIDALTAAGLGITGLALAGNHEGDAAVLPLALGAAFVGAAVRGSNAVDACRRDMDAYANEQRPDEPIVRATQPESQPATQRSTQPATQRSTQPATQPATEPEPEPAAVPSPAVQLKPQPAAAARPQPPSTNDPWRDFWEETH
jgi:outer membrane biosynthesis protein TonB